MDYFRITILLTSRMKKIIFTILSLVFISSSLFAQETSIEKVRQKGHYNTSKFKQLDEELPTPNKQHTASGAPGYEYTQQQVDYNMNIVLDDVNQKIFGEETITYHNNSKDNLEYLWVQLDQNMRAPNSKTNDVSGGGPDVLYRYFPRVHASFGAFLPLLTVQCAILAGSLFMVERSFDFGQSFVYGLGSGTGFAVAVVMLAALRRRLTYAILPAGLSGLGITFVLAGLMSLGFASLSQMAATL